MANEMYREPTGTGETTYREPTGWVGWIYFAAVLLILAGVMNAIYGFIAVVNDEWVVWGNRADVYLDLTAWGWVHIILGLAAIRTGMWLFSGNILARTVAVIVAGIAIIANFLFIPAYPVWALTVIALMVFVIYALTAHGDELRR